MTSPTSWSQVRAGELGESDISIGEFQARRHEPQVRPHRDGGLPDAQAIEEDVAQGGDAVR